MRILKIIRWLPTKVLALPFVLAFLICMVDFLISDIKTKPITKVFDEWIIDLNEGIRIAEPVIWFIYVPPIFMVALALIFKT